MSVPTMQGIRAEMITTPRISTRVLFSGDEAGEPVIFVHGNVSSATFWEETMLALPAGYRGIAPDLRGYGDADKSKKIDATRGVGDLSDDLAALMQQLGYEKAHLAGWSAGAAVLLHFIMEHPAMAKTVTLAAPSSPYGFGGTKGASGELNHADFAGSGGGTVNPAFPPTLANGDRSDAQGSPRNVLLSFYFKAPFKPAREEDLLSSMLSTHVGDKEYPGDMTPSANWPNVAPGNWGIINALTPKHQKDIKGLYSISPKPPILWVHGDGDMIVGDASFFDTANLGKLGYFPGWPGEEVAPPQPMKGQTRAVLEEYAKAGGSYKEVELDAGHTPFIEKPEEFNAVFHEFLKQA
jgi:pimeloyl-ACP methyl ester carboxylesterase